MATDVRGHTVAAGSDVFDPQGADVATSLSLNDFVIAANTSDRTTKAALLSATTGRPAFIFQTDTGVLWKYDGTNYLQVTFNDATDTGWVTQTPGSGYTAFSSFQTRVMGRNVYGRGVFRPDSGTIAAGASPNVAILPSGVRPARDYHMSACAWVSGGTPVFGGAVCGINITASTGQMTVTNGPDSALTGAQIDGVMWSLD